jgi:hypothetical protein
MKIANIDRISDIVKQKRKSAPRNEARSGFEE